MDKITNFNGTFQFLSNTYPSPVTYDGILYGSVEHAYKASALPPSERHEFIKLGISKAISRKINARQGWDEVCLDILEGLLRQKFDDIFNIERLLRTGSLELQYINKSDDFLGIVNDSGANNLGKLLMKIREDVTNKLMVCLVHEGWTPDEIRQLKPVEMLKLIRKVRQAQKQHNINATKEITVENQPIHAQ